ncbi:MAG: HAD family phosphatase [Clostridia bacterium]|nr:HAD family phosphatase [Clostridia bacterium]
MQLPKLAVFDMDGLLFDSERVLMEENAKVMAEHGYTQEFSDYVRTIGTAGDTFFNTLYEIYGDDYPAAEVAGESSRRCVERLLTEGVPVKEGIPELLDFFRERGVPCCVATSTKRPSAEAMLEKAGVRDAFSYVVTSDDVSRSKPDPEIFLLACEKNGTSPTEACVFEDSQNGVLAAYRAGIPVICIPDLKQPEPFYAEKAMKVVRSALDVPPLFGLHLNE